MRGCILSTIALATALPLHATEQPASFSSAFITGSRTYGATDFAAIIGPHVGRPVSRELVEQLASEIQALYRSDGYVMPTVIPADSDISSSTPRLHIYEAQIAEVVLRGDCGPYCNLIRADARSLESSVIHKQRTRANLRTIEELPGVRLNAVFEPRDGEPNRYNLILNMAYQAFQAGAYLHNRGTADLGRTVLGARTTFNGLLGMQERLTLRAAATSDIDNYHFIGGQLERGFAKVAASLDASISRIDTDWRYSNDRARLEIRTTAWDDGMLRLEPLIAINASDSEGREVQADYFSMVQTRTIEAGVDARLVSAGATTNLWAAVERGVDAFGAAVFTTDAASYDFVFAKAKLDASHSYMFAPKWRVRVEFDGQFSNDSLPPGERFAFGGSRFGRAFDPATLIGDSGAAGSFQVEHLRNWQSAILESGRVFIQADYGYSELNVSRQSMTAASVTIGFGARVASLLGSLELSHSLHDESHIDPDRSQPRVFLYLQMSL